MSRMRPGAFLEGGEDGGGRGPKEGGTGCTKTKRAPKWCAPWVPKKGGGLFGAEGGLAAFEEGSERFGRFGGSRLGAPDGFLFFGDRMLVTIFSAPFRVLT